VILPLQPNQGVYTGALKSNKEIREHQKIINKVSNPPLCLNFFIFSVKIKVQDEIQVKEYEEIIQWSIIIPNTKTK